MHILNVVGARPNFVKMAPVIRALDGRPGIETTTVHTGQHYDERMSVEVLGDLGLPAPDRFLGVGSGLHGAQTARVLEGMERVLLELRPDIVVVAGDVNSTLGAALAASKLGIPIAHVESGLRSFDWSMPEEINRIVTDRLSEFLFVHSSEAVENLRLEGADEERVHFVGNTMIDSLATVEPHIRGLGVAGRVGVQPREFVLVTLHRPALVDGELLREVVDQLNALARTLPVVFPVHPRTRARIDELGLRAGFHLLDPLGYLDFLSLEADAAAVLTDSGGVQEETTWLGVPCFTLRDNTERPVTLRAGTNTLLGLAPHRIADMLPALERAGPRKQLVPEGWDGHAAVRLVDLLGAAVRGGDG